MTELIEQALNGSNADYLEIRLEDRQTLNITYRGRELDEYSSRRSQGGYVRALVKGGWGYGYFTNFDQIPQICKLSEKAARQVEGKDVSLADVDPVVENITPILKNDPRDITSEEKVNLIKDYNDIIMDKEKIQTSHVNYNEVNVIKEIYTSEGAAIKEESVNMYLTAAAIAREGSMIQTSGDGFYSSMDYGSIINLDKKIEDIADNALELLSAKNPDSGKYDIVIDPMLTGVFAHEAFGHLSEADFLSENESLSEIMSLGRKFGREELNIIDDGTKENHAGCSKYDDEGVKTQKTYLIKKGTLTGRLNNRETSAKMNEPPSGNARAVNFFHEPIVRMSCTYIDKGDWDKDDMIQDIKDGYYIRGSKGGQTNLEMFTFAGRDAFRIKNGEISHMVRDINISGNLFETLGSIDAIGSDIKLHSGNGCGKGDHYPLPVSHGGPHIRIRNALVSGG